MAWDLPYVPGVRDVRDHLRLSTDVRTTTAPNRNARDLETAWLAATIRCDAVTAAAEPRGP